MAGSGDLARRASSVFSRFAFESFSVEYFNNSRPVPHDEAVFLQAMESATYGFDGQADEIGDVVPGHRYRHVVWLLGGWETMSIKKKQELRKFRSGLAEGERDRVALRFTKFVAQLAEKVEVQLRVSPEQVRETIERNSVGCYGGHRLRRSRVSTIFAESQQVSRKEKC